MFNEPPRRKPVSWALLYRRVFNNKDGREEILYLVPSNLSFSDKELKTIYKKRWNVETFHKTLKMNFSLSEITCSYGKNKVIIFFVAIFSI